METDFRLVVTDMDGTLLDGERRLPADFPHLVRALAARGIGWAIASGRQLANLQAEFAPLRLPLDIIAENGALALEAGAEAPFFCDLTPAETFRAILEASLTIPGATPVLCGADCAWVHTAHPENHPQVAHYFAYTQPWTDFAEVRHHALCKVAIYHPHAAEALSPTLLPFDDPANLRVIVSSPHWIDVQPARIHKGHALQALLDRRGLRPEQAIVFGDYLNDLEMMTLGTTAVAMANAHPALKAICPHTAPANTEDGVCRTLRALLGL